MQGAMTEERLPKEATVQVAMTMGTSVGGEASQVGRSFSSVDRAREGLFELAGSSSAAAVQLYESTARVQAMTGQVCNTGHAAFLYTLYHHHHLSKLQACHARNPSANLHEIWWSRARIKEGLDCWPLCTLCFTLHMLAGCPAAYVGG